jgi:hypothetical protein
LAGRTKVDQTSAFEKKQLKGDPFGRAVWMADQHEQVLAGRYVQPCLEYFHQNLDIVCLGFNKFTHDPTRVASTLEKYNCFINGDFSKFDLHVSPTLINRAFSVMRYMHNVPKDSGSREDRLFNWLQDQFVYTRVVLPTGRVVITNGGIPSGSGLTSIIGSLVNAILWFEALNAQGVSDYSLKVSGDDNYLGFDVPPQAPETRIRSGFKMLEKFKETFFSFGMELGGDTIIGAHLYAGYITPRAPEKILDGSSDVLARYWREQTEKLGRKPTLFEKYRLLEDEPIGPAPGNTHRWSYLFQHRAPFLSHYFKKDRSKVGGGKVMMIRPTHEVVQNLTLPESPVRKLSDHLDRLRCALVENLGNHHVVNHIMHYTYDAYLMEKAGVKTPRDLRRLWNHPQMEKRGWYRKQEKVVDLTLSDLDFDKYWSKFYDSARILHGATFGSQYSDWGKIRALRKGRLVVAGGFGAGGYPHRSTYEFLAKNRRAYEIIGSFGFALFENPTIRGACFWSFQDSFENGTFSHQGNGALELQRRTTVLRWALLGDKNLTV